MYIKEVNMRTFSDKKAYHIVLELEKNISDSVIKNVIESLCNVWVKSIKDVREYEPKKGRSEIDVRDINWSYEYPKKGLVANKARQFLPKLHNRHNSKDVETQFKKLFGSSFKVKTFIEPI